VETEPGVEVGRVWRGLDRVAAYVPGGTAAYPSSLLMSAIPARLAGVGQFVVASPAGANGELSPALLGAAGLMEVDEFWVMGGAQAVGALAYGTESIRRVDKIVGPGNAWVTAAKLEVLDSCAIDMPAGPTEVMVVVDDTADPVHVAADLLSQAEHGPDSPALLVTPSEALADAVEAELARQLPTLARRETLATSLAAAGTVVITADVAEALAFADEYAPEHLSCVVADLDAALEALRHAGSLFLRAYAPESAGDYAAGSNHVLPTAGGGRAYSPLGVESFGRWMQVNRISREGLARILPAVAAVAEAEGLTAHRRAVEIRFEEPG
jgi:histidinol dehydrogenase